MRKLVATAASVLIIFGVAAVFQPPPAAGQPLPDPRKSGEAQVIVGTCLVLGSALGSAAASFLVGPLGYRGLFAVLAGLGAVATAIVVFFVPETLGRHDELLDDRVVDPRSMTSDLSTVP